MKTLLGVLLAVSFAVAFDCEEIIEFMRKCADYGIDYGQKGCLRLERYIYNQVYRATGLKVQSKAVASSCYNACVLQAEFYEVADSIYAVCKKRGR